MHQGAEICQEKEKVCKDSISALPDDLLVEILSQIPTRDAVTTMVLSKRWRFLWTMVYNLDYVCTDEEDKSSVWDFLEKLIELHKAPVLESLRIKLGRHCPYGGDVGKCVSHAVERSVRELNIDCDNLYNESLPKSLYTCKTLVKLTLSSGILVDVPSSVCLPSLLSLDLVYVEYKDEDTHVRLLSSCPVLKDLLVDTYGNGNVNTFSVKVPSLETLTYRKVGMHFPDYDTSLVIDSPGLKQVVFEDLGDSRKHCSFNNMPRLDAAIVTVFWVDSHPHDKFMTYFSSVVYLELQLTDVAFCNGVNFSRLLKLKLWPKHSDKKWLESFMHLLHNSPKLIVLTINSRYNHIDSPLLWNQPSSVPGCLLSHLEYFVWDEFRGRREEKQFLAYILANSMCLKTVIISSSSLDRDYKKDQKMKVELESMYRASPSSELLFNCDEDVENEQEEENHQVECVIRE